MSRFSKSDAFASAVLIDEINARSFKSTPYRSFVGERNWDFPVNDLDPTDRRDTHFGCSCQIKSCPSEHRPSCTHLSTRDFFCHYAIDVYYTI
jgi:hypothetical protein